jgi:hypothetical protein
LVLLVRPRTRQDEKSNNSLIQRERQRDRDREKKTERKKERKRKIEREKENERERQAGGQEGRQWLGLFVCLTHQNIQNIAELTARNIITFKSRLLLARIFYFSFLM